MTFCSKLATHVRYYEDVRSSSCAVNSGATRPAAQDGATRYIIPSTAATASCPVLKRSNNCTGPSLEVPCRTLCWLHSHRGPPASRHACANCQCREAALLRCFVCVHACHHCHASCASRHHGLVQTCMREVPALQHASMLQHEARSNACTTVPGSCCTCIRHGIGLPAGCSVSCRYRVNLLRR